MPGGFRSGVRWIQETWQVVNDRLDEVTVQTSGVELAEGLLMTAGLSVNSRYEAKNSRRSDTQIPLKSEQLLDEVLEKPNEWDREVRARRAGSDRSAV